MADTQQQIRDGSGAKELVILVGILLTVIAGSIGTYWVRSKGVEAAPGMTAAAGTPAGEPSRPRVTIPAPPAGVFHTDVYFDFKSSRLRADAARVLQETAGSMDLSNAWVVLVQGYADRQGPAEYNRVLAQRRAESVKQFLVELGVPESSIRLMTMGRDGALCEEPAKECQQLNRRVHLEFRKLAAGTPPGATATSTAAPSLTGPTSPAGDR
jgi:outer membrane protein OmpA-like peptidoglycan-associated protein